LADTCLNDLSIAPVTREGCRRIRITHPFYPLHGKQFELIEHRFIFTESYVYFYEASGHLREIPALSLISFELFGHEKGRVHRVMQRRLGRFELANVETIFLDEIG
jgi:sigma-54 interacting transcriptional regulator/uncharacterized protein DUF5372